MFTSVDVGPGSEAASTHLPLFDATSSHGNQYPGGFESAPARPPPARGTARAPPGRTLPLPAPCDRVPFRGVPLPVPDPFRPPRPAGRSDRVSIPPSIAHLASAGGPPVRTGRLPG